MIDHSQRVVAWRIVYGGLLTALYARGFEYVGKGLQAIETPIVAHPLLPEVFLSGKLALIAYGIVFVGLFSFLCGHRRVLQSVSILTFGCSLFLLWGSTFGTDATFVTSTWVSAWLVWFSFRMEDSDPEFVRRAIFFGKGIAGLCFLGGAAGKVTSEYWSGGVFYRLFFESSDYWFFAKTREVLNADELRQASMYFSRLVVVTELVLGTLILWPIRWALGAVAMVVVGMVVTFHPTIYSAVGSLLWLLAGCLYLGRHSSR
ncbi:hypothetical protein OAF27_01965 [Verrucomicrobiales bacterium]|nr:hypothetical protein [Verrucomicrobiales bacterium]